jgi:hypothetical protein
LGHDLIELLLIVVSEVILFLVITLVVGVVPVGVVILIGGVELLPLGVVSDKVGGVTALEAALGDLLLSLQNLCKARNFLISRAILSLGMLSYCPSEDTTKEDKTNSKVDETVMVGLAS